MKRNLILAGVLSIVAGLCGNAVASEINWTAKRASSVNRGTMESHLMLLKSGTHHVGLVARSRTNMAVAVFRVVKDESGQIKLQKVQLQKVSKDGLTLIRFHVAADGLYFVRAASMQDTENYAILTTGKFVGKAVTSKLNSRS